MTELRKNYSEEQANQIVKQSMEEMTANQSSAQGNGLYIVKPNPLVPHLTPAQQQEVAKQMARTSPNPFGKTA